MYLLWDIILKERNSLLCTFNEFTRKDRIFNAKNVIQDLIEKMILKDMCSCPQIKMVLLSISVIIV